MFTEMDEPEVEPLTLILENTNGDEVAVEIKPHDNFQMFLEKATSLLGFEIDLNSITDNQPVLLTDNIYEFLMNAEQNESNENLGTEKLNQTLDENNENDLVYVLDDGTQINASQIQFDNEDTPVDFTAEKIPFVKYADDSADEPEADNDSAQTTKKINIVESPVGKWSSQNASPKCSFINSLPFKLVCNNTSNFEAQFTKYLESSTLNIPSSNAPMENFNSYYKSFKRNRKDELNLTREDILNMFKDAPVTSVPYEEKGISDKRKHVRKTDPARLVHKTWNLKPLSCVIDGHSQKCFICKKLVDSNLEKLYLFDNEDQKLHRCSPQRRYSTQLKILCQQCLSDNFKPCTMKSPSQSLKPDEYLIIKNNQQYIFQKVTSINLKDFDNVYHDEDKENRTNTNTFIDVSDKSVDFVKVEIGSDGEIVTKSLYEEPGSSDDVIIVRDKNNSSSDVEIIEPDIDDNVIDIENLDEADEGVKEFLGKYQCNDLNELKCRFCDQKFEDFTKIMDHGDEHKHETEEGSVYPCPLCDYGKDIGYSGYANIKWLKAHIKAAHDKPKSKENVEIKDNNEAKEGNESKDGEVTKASVESKECVVEETNSSPIHSPVAKRTRSAIKKGDCHKEKETCDEKQTEVTKEVESNESLQIEKPQIEIKMEVKQEVINSSDDEIWILQTGDDDEDRVQEILESVKIKKEGEIEVTLHNCATCSQSFTSTTALLEHKCGPRRRGRKRKSNIPASSSEGFIKRAQGKFKQVTVKSDLLVERTRKKRNRQPTSDPQIVTCNDCNESFTSKVRLKFHMQFHEPNSFQTSSGEYYCAECDDTQFPTESELFDHVHFQHDKQKRWPCPVKGCGKTFFLRATLTKHSRTHTDTRRYGCDKCGKRFLDKQTLDEHGVTHLQIKPFQCHICLKQLTRRSRLRMHLRAHEEELTPKLVLVCAVCSRAFRDQPEAQEHATKSSECIAAFADDLKEEAETVTEQLSPTSGVVRHSVKVVESPRFTKPIDREVSNTESEAMMSSLEDSAKTIIRVVRIEKAFRCEYCEDVFYQEDALNSHRSVHKNVKNPFTCHICKVSFATYSRCTTHKTTHGFYKRSLADAKKQSDNGAPGQEAGPSATGILGYGGFPVAKHFLCEDCGRSYLHWTYLQVHRRMKHANEKFIFKCNLCEVTFPNSWSVAYHRKKVHGKTGQEDGGVTKIARDDYRIPCRDCDEILPNKTALYKHRKKEHSDGSFCFSSDGNYNSARTCCAKCGHNFSQPEDLLKHLNAVHGHESDLSRRSNPSLCSLCGRPNRWPAGRGSNYGAYSGTLPCVCGTPFRSSTTTRNNRIIPPGVRMSVCPHCPKKFRAPSELKAHLRSKHSSHFVIIEVQGLNPSSEEILNQLKTNNINPDKVLEITLMSFEKGTTSVIPHSRRALSALESTPKTVLTSWRPSETAGDFQVASSHPVIIPHDLQRPQISVSEMTHNQNGYPITLNVSEEALSALNIQLMMNDEGNGNDTVQLHVENMLLE